MLTLAVRRITAVSRGAAAVDCDQELPNLTELDMGG